MKRCKTGCSTHGGNEKYTKHFSLKTLDGLGVDEEITLQRILKKRGVNWIELAKDRVQWKALLNTVMKFRVP
jgi:hypothetical protein